MMSLVEEYTGPSYFVSAPRAQGAFVTELYMTHALLGSMAQDAFLVSRSH